MFNLPQPIKGISHPMVRDIYLKKELGTNSRREENVLVIEARDSESGEEHELFDSYLIDILSDLDQLQSQVRQQAGSFDRIDIRRH